MPKTAINYYNLRKGLYLKNGGSRGLMMSRESSKAIASHDVNQATTKSVGILNAYGELAADYSVDANGAISTQLTQFHRN